MQSTTQDRDHLRLLSIFHYVVGGFAGVFALLPILHLGLGLALIFAPEKFSGSGQPPPAFLGWIFVALAAVAMLAGFSLAILMLLSGRFLAQRRRYKFCFVVAAIECLFMPFGTALGIFTILVLSRESVKNLFSETK